MFKSRVSQLAAVLLCVFVCRAAVCELLPVKKRLAASAGFVLPFELSDNRIIVTAIVDGGKTARLLLDSGADQGALTQEAARRFGLHASGNQDQTGTGDRAVRWAETQVQELRLGSAVFHDVRMGVFSGEDFANVFGSRSPDGILGKPIFERYVIAIDYQRRMLRFIPPELYVAPSDAVVVPFQLPNQIPVVEAQLDGVSGHFGIDTGARSALLLYRPFAEEHSLRQKYNARVEGVTGWGLGGPIRSLLVRAHRLRFGNFDVQNPVIRLSLQTGGATTSSSMAGLIGPDILSRFQITFDYSHHRLLLIKSRDFDRADSYDRAGLWMGWDGKQFTAIDVISGGPADAAGIRNGDRLLAIDGVSTASLILPDVREAMRRKAPGSHVMIRVEHDGSQRNVDVCLHDLV